MLQRNIVFVRHTLLALTVFVSACGLASRSAPAPCEPGGPLAPSCAPEGMTPMRTVSVPAGTFTMGCDPMRDGVCQGDETPITPVTLTRPLLVGIYEVTQAEYEVLIRQNPSRLGGCPSCPVEQVTWREALTWCNTRSEADGLTPAYDLDGEEVRWRSEANGWRLPTEAEWEYLARGGEEWPYAGSSRREDVAWYEGNSGGRHHPVGEKPANAFGLHDMSGNVWEWTWSRRWTYPGTPLIDPEGGATGADGVVRGGAWADFASGTRVAYRGFPPITNKDVMVGFRVVRWREDVR